MALSWKLLDYTTGMVIRSEGLPVSDESAEVATDIHGEDAAEIDIIRDELTADENNNWRETFALLLRGVALDDDSKPWDDATAISFSGFINKLNDDINPRKIKAQITGPTEYTKGRIVADTWTPVSDPTTTVDFSGSNWAEVMASAFIKCFSSDGIPAGKPKPYNILGKIQYPDGTLITPTGTTVTKSVKVTDAMTYHDLVTSISDEAGGLEWRMVTRWIDSTRLQAVVDITIGTTAVPHIKEDVTLSLDLAENDAKFSAYSGTFDSNELYSKLYIQSVSGDQSTKDGADFAVASVDDTEFPVLFERFFNPGVALTTEERDAQLSARLSFAAKPKYETSLTVEEKFDPAEWIAHLGKKLILTGVANTPSAGHDATVRIVGITFTPGKGTVKAQLMQLGPTYPRLPKDRLQNLSGYNGNSLPVPTSATITPVVPTVPTGGVGVDGVPSLSNKWGDQGRNPWDTNPDKITNPDLADYKDITYNFTSFDGETVFHPYTACQNEGNRIYGLDHAVQVAGTLFYGSTPTHYAGGVDWRTGAPLAGWKPFYILKTYMTNGELGPIDTVGVISADQIKAMVAPYNRNMAYGSEDANYETSIMSVNWIIDGRFYFGLASRYRTKIGSSNWQEGQMPSNSYYNGRVAIISSGINNDDGKIVGDWRNENSSFPNYGFPMTPFIARSGKCVAFTQFYQLTQHEFTDATYQDFSSFQNAAYSSSGGWAPLSVDHWYNNFGDSAMWQNKPGTNTNDTNLPGMDWGLGSLYKDYSTIDSPFKPYAGFNVGTQNKRASGGVAHMAFASDGNIYGIHRWASQDIKKLSMSDTKVGDGAWQTIKTIVEDNGAVFTNFAIVKGCGYFGEKEPSGTPSAKLFPLEGGTVKSITAEPYINFGFRDSNGNFINYDMFNAGGGFAAGMNGSGMASKIFSYDGRLYTFRLMPDSNGVKNTIILHSMQVVSAA